MQPQPADDPTGSELFRLQLLVARRADALARERECAGLLKLECWLLAEAEILKSAEFSTPFFRSERAMRVRREFSDLVGSESARLSSEKSDGIYSEARKPGAI
jgi:hypothetical protein